MTMDAWSSKASACPGESVEDALDRHDERAEVLKQIGPA